MEASADWGSVRMVAYSYKGPETAFEERDEPDEIRGRDAIYRL